MVILFMVILLMVILLSTSDGDLVDGDEEENGDRCIYHELPSHPALGLLPPCIIVVIIIIIIFITIIFIIITMTTIIPYFQIKIKGRKKTMSMKTSGCSGHDLSSV